MDSIYFRDPDGNLIEVSQYWDAARQRHESLRDLESGQAALNELLARLSDERMQQPATIGDGDWSAKDLLGHVAAWEQLALKALGELRGWDVPLPGEEGWPGTDAFNAQVHERTSTQALHEVRLNVSETHAMLVKRVRQLSDDEWQTPRGDQTLGDVLGSLTGGSAGPFRHVRDHLEDLRHTSSASSTPVTEPAAVSLSGKAATRVFAPDGVRVGDQA